MGRSVSITIAPIAKQHRTFADLILYKLDIFGLHCGEEERRPKTSSLVAEIDYHESRGLEPYSRKSNYESRSTIR